MTKADLINEVSKKTGIEKIVVKETIETFMDIIKDSLKNNENVYLRKFGSFIVKKRAQKTMETDFFHEWSDDQLKRNL